MDIKQIQRQFNEVLAYSQEKTVSTDELFSVWQYNKKRFIDAFNGEAIYELPQTVTFTLDEAAKASKTKEFLDWAYQNFPEEIYNFLDVNSDGIWANKLMSDWDETCRRGMKLSKALMQLFGPVAESARQALAMLIQSDKVSGQFCISVHPLDFLSASENTHGWRSCHALDGEYRAGNVSYMADNITAMVYLKSKDNTILPHFPANVPWNNKKWRCYVFFDKENGLVYLGRQYPFHSKSAIAIVEELLHKFDYFDAEYAKLYKTQVTRWSWQQPENVSLPKREFKHCCLRADTKVNEDSFYFGSTKVIVGCNDEERRIVPLTKFVGTNPDALCFNDLINNHLYSPYILSYFVENENCVPLRPKTKLMLGNSFKCLHCGLHQPADSDTFFCRYCSDREYEYDDEDEEEES